MKEYDGALENRFSFSYDISSFYSVFLQKGMSDLMKHLSNRDIFLAIYVCEPYSFLVGYCKESYFLLDVHPVSEAFRCARTGVVVTSDNVNSLYSWLLRRLYESGVKEESKQMLSVAVFEEK